MSLVVQKFGGTSVANAERIRAAARRAVRAQQAGQQVVVVVSARGDTTDDLIRLAEELSDNPPAREMDMLLSTGEQISIALMAMALHDLGADAISFTGSQIGILTDSSHTKARIQRIDTSRMRRALQRGQIVIVAGFQGIDQDLNITTLGRGGSDTTAVALAAALKHDPAAPSEDDRDVDCEIFTDVDGVYTTDPRLVPEARKIDALSYDEMLELASMGAGVMHSRAIEFGKKFGVPLMVRSSFSDVEGTWVIPEADWMREVLVCGAAIAKDEARILLEGVPDRPGVSHQLFAALARVNIAVDMIAQTLGSNDRASIGFTIPRDELPQTIANLGPLVEELGGAIRTVEDVSKVSVVGTGMRTHPGVAERMFGALADAGINIQMITTGDIKISVLVEKPDAPRALRAVHQAFGLHLERVGAGLPSPGGEADYRPKPGSEPLPPAAEGTTILTPNGAGTVKPPETNMDDSALLAIAQLADQLTSMEAIVVSGVELSQDHGRITIHDLLDQPGNCSRLFNAIARAGIVVDMIIQNITNPGMAEVSFSLPKADLERGLEATRSVMREISPAARVAGESDNAVLFVYGVGMRTHTGVAERMFGALAEADINIRLINTSETCISVVVAESRGQEALRVLRQCFGVEERG